MSEIIVRTGTEDGYDEKWGRFFPEWQFNVDQPLCSFVVDWNGTYHLVTEEQNNEKVWISQWFLLICFSPQYKQLTLVCFLEMEKHIRRWALPGKKMLKCFSRKRIGKYSSCIRLGKQNFETCYRQS